MTQYNFGTGNLYSVPLGGGNPLRFGALQDVSIEFSGDIKQLHGQFQYPLDVARGKAKIEGKISSGNIDVEQFNALYFGEASTPTGEKKQAINEAAVIPTTPFTVTAANGANFYLDLGVTDVLTGLPFKQVASAPTTGQYTVNQTTGLYTFAAADTGKAILLNYLWTSSTTGKTVSISNQLMGASPTFQLVSSQLYKGKTFTMVLYSVVIDKLSVPLKMDDHTITDMGFQAQANSANNVGFITTTGGA